MSESQRSFAWTCSVLRAVLLAAAGLATALLAAAATADAHAPQWPDLSPLGRDVLAGPMSVDAQGTALAETFVADDWLAATSDVVTDLQVWGSYNQDRNPRSLGLPSFSLAIYANVPAAGELSSRPGNLLWSAYARPMAAGLDATAEAGFFDPVRDTLIGSDSQTWKFKFSFDPQIAFRQTEGAIYWLGIHYSADLNDNGFVDLFDYGAWVAYWPAAFGWKTTTDSWLGDAVWTPVPYALGNPHVAPVVNGSQWRPLVEPNAQGSRVLPLAFVVGRPLADFDGDVDVDGADLALWTANCGLSETAARDQGDADGDRDVDGADLLVWQRQLGGQTPAPPVAAGVPEPAACLLAGLAAAALAARRRRLP